MAWCSLMTCPQVFSSQPPAPSPAPDSVPAPSWVARGLARSLPVKLWAPHQAWEYAALPGGAPAPTAPAAPRPLWGGSIWPSSWPQSPRPGRWLSPGVIKNQAIQGWEPWRRCANKAGVCPLDSRVGSSQRGSLKGLKCGYINQDSLT